jgi:hypothetical protein
MEDLILNRNLPEKRHGVAAVLVDPGPEGIGGHEGLLVAKPLHEVET